MKTFNEFINEGQKVDIELVISTIDGRKNEKHYKKFKIGSKVTWTDGTKLKGTIVGVNSMGVYQFLADNGKGPALKLDDGTTIKGFHNEVPAQELS